MESANTKQKIFCVGNNKTGTTSLMKFVRDLGIVVGDQRRSEDLAFRYLHKNTMQEFWSGLLAEINLAQFFQDIPFSNPNILRGLLQHFPDTKYIYTTRRPDDWYRPLVKFHGGAAGFNLTQDDDGGVDFDTKDVLEKLQTWQYRDFSGLSPLNQHFGFDNSDDPYNRNTFIDFHLRHAENAARELKGHHSLFIDITKSHSTTVTDLMSFLSVDNESLARQLQMPHLNKASS
jgi:hypothetical protein